jgi:glycosyltransferase involved in cell wall biosynthesis
MASPEVTVVICCYTEQRWDDVLAAVDSAQKQQLAPAEVLVVVDHNDVLAERLRLQWAGSPVVRVLTSGHPRGLSGARNTGVEAARGDIVAFLDDDAVADEEWLSRLTECYDEPHVLGVGGRTLPVWASGGRPRWYPEEFDWVHGASYLGMPSGRARVRNVLGGNASFRRGVLEAVGGFDTGIGRGAEDGGRVRPLGGEETELCIRAQQRDPSAVFLFEGRAVIHHKVPLERERFGYLVSRCWAEGISKAMVAGRVGAGDGLATERRYVTRVLPAGVLSGLRQAAHGDPAGLGRAGAIVGGALAAAAGYAAGSLRRGGRG